MTAEVAVLNSIGLALAADSAVSIGRDAEKVYASADKLFQLHATASVGVMIFGNANIVGMPWETVIKVFRREIGDQTYATLEEYADRFLDFLRTPSDLFSPTREGRHVQVLAGSLLIHLRGQLKEALDDEAKKSNGLKEADISRICKRVFDKRLETVKKQAQLDGFGESDRRSLRKKYGAELREIRQEVFGNLPITRAMAATLNSIVVEMLTRHYFGPMSGGIVIAGFGENEFLPRLMAYEVEEFAAGKPRIFKSQEVAISDDNGGFIIPFAQQEMVHAFMEGVDRDFMSHVISSTRELFHGAISAIIKDIKDSDNALGEEVEKNVLPAQRKALNALFGNWKQCREQFWRPVLEIVAALPKDELAAMAESLVNLTKFRRRVTRVRETVGGPIDVAVITKGDGFVWVRRKHYFSPELNPRVIARYGHGA